MFRISSKNVPRNFITVYAVITLSSTLRLLKVFEIDVLIQIL